VVAKNQDTPEHPVQWDGSPVKINMFGGFSIQVGEVVIKNSSSRSYQLWNLLEYLIAFRHKPIPTSEMYDALWDEDEVDNPASALKNLVYRIRSVFSDYDLPFSKTVVTYQGGTYQWSSTIPCVVDIEVFEGLYERASSLSLPQDMRIETYKQAIDLYKGDFLASSNYKNWAVPVAGYYKSIYFKCVAGVLGLLAEQECFGEVEEICQKALIIDQLEEMVHEHLILALSKQGQQAKAIAHYKHVSNLFLNELGVHPSASLRNLYRQIAKSVQSVEIDIEIIQQDLKEIAPPEGAFYCEYEIFKSIYQVLSREAPRTGLSIFVVLFTLTDQAGEMPGAELRRKAMDGLFRAIRSTTRQCDVFSRFSGSQYVLLLSTDTLPHCMAVTERVTKKLKTGLRTPEIEIHTAVKPLE